MTRTRTCLVLFALLLPGSIALSQKPPEVVPGEVLVKFSDAVEVCVESAFRHRGSRPELEELFSELRLREVRAIFRSLDGQEEVAGGTPGLSVEALRADERRTLAKGRAARGLEGLPPELPELFHIYRLRFEGGRSPSEVAAELSRDPRVVFAEPNFLASISELPGDPFVDGDQDGSWELGSWGEAYPDLWGLQALGWQGVWEQR
ncbi:MAG: hypothetical protein KDD47_26520, partial [Acidobacteria bacterium]|nr:hypothetical protein [Acidobacteriota bacterium]